MAATKRPVLPPVTRAEAVSTLLNARATAHPTGVPAKTFTDVPPFAWYADTMAAGEYFGIVAADPQGRVRPDDPVTRAEFLKMTALTFGLPQGLKQPYADVPADAWFSPFAGIAHAYQLFPSDPDQGTLLPHKLITRPEAAGIVSFFVKDRERTAEVERERTVTKEQADKRLQLYLTMSTRRQNVKLVWPQERTPETRTVAPRGRPSLEDTRRRIVELVNASRAKNGLPPVRANGLLDESAQTYAREMAIAGFFSHVSPDGRTLRDRVSAVGYYDIPQDPGCLCVRGMAVGENLGRGQVTAEQVMEDWMKSASHRRTILTREFTDIGVGVSAGYWVQHFGGVIEIAAKP